MRVITQDDQLVLKFQGVEQFYGFCRRICMPKSEIESIEWLPTFRDWHIFEFRAPGSFLPGAIMAGSYYSPRGWDFVYSTKPKGWTRPELKDVMVIKLNKHRYKRIIVGATEDDAKKARLWLTQTA